ncbi:RNase H [Megamonas hypermegale]|nr:viroplasmin family protein [Megamonas hypermegale]MBM6832819.1 viroplasmin family protein [Megamonas hypermegale]OUO41724.1 RNase H [Megamonas hypermegale]
MIIKKKFYAVKKGYKTGIFDTWAQCQKQTQGFKGALFKSFATLEEAKNYLNDDEAVNIMEKDDDRYYIYVDGSYINGQYSWGMAIYHQGKLIDTFNGIGKSKDASELHNVAGEIEGAMEAAKWAAANGDKVVICHDYIGLSEWALGRWKTNKELTKHYADFMKPYLDLVSFKKVAGHTGVEGNELADKLAKQALGL